MPDGGNIFVDAVYETDDVGTVLNGAFLQEICSFQSAPEIYHNVCVV